MTNQRGICKNVPENLVHQYQSEGWIPFKKELPKKTPRVKQEVVEEPVHPQDIDTEDEDYQEQAKQKRGTTK
jgi:hypothetical protein